MRVLIVSRCPPGGQEIPLLVDIASFCTWQHCQDMVLAELCRLCNAVNGHALSQLFFIGNIVVMVRNRRLLPPLFPCWIRRRYSVYLWIISSSAPVVDCPHLAKLCRLDFSEQREQDEGAYCHNQEVRRRVPEAP